MYPLHLLLYFPKEILVNIRYAEKKNMVAISENAETGFPNMAVHRSEGGINSFKQAGNVRLPVAILSLIKFLERLVFRSCFQLFSRFSLIQRHSKHSRECVVLQETVPNALTLRVVYLPNACKGTLVFAVTLLY